MGRDGKKKGGERPHAHGAVTTPVSAPAAGFVRVIRKSGEVILFL